MLYVITGRDSPRGLEIRRRVRATHLVRAQALADAGRLVIGGPCPTIDSPDPGSAGYSGSVIIAEFDSLADAQSWIAVDPYVTEGVFADYEVRPFVKVLP